MITKQDGEYIFKIDNNKEPKTKNLTYLWEVKISHEWHVV